MQLKYDYSVVAPSPDPSPACLLLARAAQLRSRIERKRQRITEAEAELERVTREADELADEFRDRFSAASEAYDEGARGDAKALAEEGRELQDECEDLNDQAAEIRDVLRHLRAELRDLATAEQELRQSARRAARSPSGGREESLPRLHGWTDATMGVTAADVTRWFEELLPPEHSVLVRQIRVESHDATAPPERRARVRAATGDIWIHPPRNSPTSEPPEFRSRNLARVLMHEVGHIVYLAASDAQIRRYREALGVAPLLMHSLTERYPTLPAKRLRRELFADLYAEYLITPDDLLRNYPHLYNFCTDHVFQGREYQRARW